MGKGEKNNKAAKSCLDEDLQFSPSNPAVVPSDDEEANEDLSLKIVEKAMLRASTSGQNMDGALDKQISGFVADFSSLSSQETQVQMANVKSNKKSRKEKKKKKDKEVENLEQTVVVAKEEEKSETTTINAIDKLVDTNPAEMSDNQVLRKLLRGPRYFDPPDGGWGTCYNCGQEGHTSVNCTSAKRKKPCFFCGSLEHTAKQCNKGQDCFICRQGGHWAKDCPEKYKKGSHNSKICLKCGGSGHEMFSCKNDYSPDDLMAVQCYMCKSFGHLCCADFTDTGPRELSCYRCGQLGHSGLDCKRSHGDTANAGSPGLCFRCGEAGHFARECTSKVCNSNLDLSTPTWKNSKENGDLTRVRSVPSDLGKARKRKKNKFEDVGYTTPSKSKRRGGWITEDPRDLPCGKAKVHGWGSPRTPAYKRKNNYSPVSGGYASTSYSSRRTQKFNFGASASNGSSTFYQRRYSASRFGDNSSGWMRRNYDW